MNQYGISPSQLKKLLAEHKKDPTNGDIMNLLALGYYENYQMKTMKGIDEEEYYFEGAYTIKKTVKSIHNYAWYLFYEKYDHKKAYNVQKECIALKPKTHSPYLLYCEILMEFKKYEQALKVLLKLQKTYSSRVVEHNIGYCYFKLGDFESAKKYFSDASLNGDDESKSLFSLAVTYYKLGEKEKIYSILDTIIDSELFENSFFTYELASLYFLYDDYQKVKDFTLKLGINGIDLLDWIDIGYAIYTIDEDLFSKVIKADIQKMEGYLQEIESGNRDGDLTAKEKKELIRGHKKEIQRKQNYHSLFKEKPKCDIERSIISEYSNCTLFDCKRHNNPRDDI